MLSERRRDGSVAASIIMFVLRAIIWSVINQIINIIIIGVFTKVYEDTKSILLSVAITIYVLLGIASITVSLLYFMLQHLSFPMY